MCGFIATFTDKPLEKCQADASLNRLRSRGPDGEGRWQQGGVFLGHRRLAILDLDDRATQPMVSSCGRYIIVFNGEIYNFNELRRILEVSGENLRTTSDTEVILSFFAREGEAMLPRLKGMFAFVIWDSLEQKAFAARDPYGIKPLYVAHFPGGVALASQVKALLATGLVGCAPNMSGQAGYWMLGSVPEPHTWYRDIRCLQAGHWLWVKSGRISSTNCWHDISSVWRDAAEQNVSKITEQDLCAIVRASLIEAIDRHLVSDVPIGVFLSGGIDSGVIAALMQERGASSLIGVTITYDEFSGHHEDEAPGAALLAKQYGIRHHIRRVGHKEFAADLPRILAAMDQPSIDGINTWYASKAVAELGLKVVMSGVGGDELFLGYDSFRTLPRLSAAWELISMLPRFSKIADALAHRKARCSSEARWRYAPAWLSQGISGAWWLRRSSLAPEIAAMRVGSTVDADFSPSLWISDMAGPLASNRTLALAQIETTCYLRNQLLRDSDWASMDHSVELRTPLVDATLLENLKHVLPHFYRYPGKKLLGYAPSNPLPKAILNRRKTGFGIPIQQWTGAKFNLQDGWQQKVITEGGWNFQV